MAEPTTNSARQQPALPQHLDGQSSLYQQWKHNRLQRQHSYNADASRILSINPTVPLSQSNELFGTICQQVHDYGFTLYQWSHDPQDIASCVGEQNRHLSLQDADQGVVQSEHGLSLLTDLSGSDQGRFIPYTARAMGWHTDGYYNPPSQPLRSFTLHCINPAADGGTLTLMDYELLLIAAYDDNPELIELLSHPHSMMLPANKDDLGHDRPDQHVPVFFGHSDGSPGLRFTTRTKNIHWRNEDTRAAAEQLTRLIVENPQWHHRVRLQSGQGVITRNILHSREPFIDKDDQAPRQILRGRYLQRPQLIR